MKRHRSRLGLSLIAASSMACLLLLQSCGPAAAPKPAAIVVPPPARAETPATPRPRQTASDEIKRYWALGEGSTFAVYADLEGFFRTPLVRSLLPAVLELGKGTLDDAQIQCMRDLLASAKELAAGAHESGESAIVVFRYDEQLAKPKTCLVAADAKPIRFEGRNAYAMKNALLIHEPGLVLFGRPPAIREALRARQGNAVFPASLSLAAEQYVAWTIKEDDISAQGSLLASDTRFRLDAEADMPATLATRLEAQFGMMENQDFGEKDDKNAREMLKNLMRAIKLTRDGGHIGARYELLGTPAEQARDLGRTAALAIYGVRKYIADAKAAEARNSLGQIAKDYVTLWEDGKPRAKRKLVSFPPVPTVVPRGTKYPSTAADWKPWLPLSFSLEMPQYFQYEVRAAKDGESAEILARGDLDGDGKTSLFRLTLKIDRTHDSLSIAPHIEETDPEE